MATDLETTGSKDPVVQISIEILNPDSYSDLVKQRRPGTKYRPANGKSRAIAVSYKDKIVLPMFENEPLGAAGKAIDNQIGGNLSATLQNEGFTGRQGESLTVNLEEAGFGSGNARRITLIGMGESSNQSQFSVCGLAGMIISGSQIHLDENVILPLEDLLKTPEEISHFVTVLCCRLEHHLATQVEHGLLKKIRVLVSSANAQPANEGVKRYHGRLCAVCSEPEL